MKETEINDEVVKLKSLAEDILNDEASNIIKNNLIFATTMVGVCLLLSAYVIRVLSTLFRSNMDGLSLNIATEVVGALFIFLTLGAIAKSETSRLRRMIIGWVLLVSSVALIISGLVFQDSATTSERQNIAAAASSVMKNELFFYTLNLNGMNDESVEIRIRPSELRAIAQNVEREFQEQILKDSTYRHYSYLGDMFVNLGVELGGSLLIFLLLEQASRAIELKRKRELDLIAQITKLQATLEFKRER